MRGRLKILSRSFIVFFNSLSVSGRWDIGRYPTVSETIPELVDSKGKFSLELATFAKPSSQSVILCFSGILGRCFEIDYSF